MNEIKFLGFIFDADGRHPDPENVKTIEKLSALKDSPSFHVFRGLISHYSIFLP